MTSRPNRIALTACLALACCFTAGVLSAQAGTEPQGSFPASISEQLQSKTADILTQRCAMCHGGATPRAKLSLTRETFAGDVTDVPSTEVTSLKIVDTATPEASYILMKLRGDKGITGERMPLDGPALPPEELQTIELWVQALSVVKGTQTAPAGAGAARGAGGTTGTAGFTTPPFYGTSLIDLPTTHPLDKGETLFRISHRFIEPTNAGHEYFLGLDGPAYIYLSLGYGLTDWLSFELGRTNLVDEINLAARVSLLTQTTAVSRPVSALLYIGGTLTTERPPEASLWNADNMHFNIQLALSRQFTERLSILCVPSYSGNTDYADPRATNTTSLGLGGRLLLIQEVSIIAEWIPVISGGETTTDTWGVGVEKKLGGHVFHVFINNAYGLTPNQYIPGGDLTHSDIRLGFNIYRTL